MPLNSSLVGLSAQPLVHEVDARWLMAYAAGLNDALPRYLDTLGPDGIVGHPMFSVCFQWPAMVALREKLETRGLTPEEGTRGIHATHDVLIHRLLRPGIRVTTHAAIVGVQRRRAGAYVNARLDSYDSDGTHLCSTLYGTTYLNTPVEGPDRPTDDWPHLATPAQMPPTAHHQVKIPVAAVAAHVYTECARIWNPIHTDPQAAAAAGLREIILHGTATLALAVSSVVKLYTPNRPELVSRVAGRFTAMVPMPSELTLQIIEREHRGDADLIHFEVLNGEGVRALRDGVVALRHHPLS